MKRLLVLMALLGGGCLVVPATKTVSRPLGSERGPERFHAQRAVQLGARVEGDHVLVHATRVGECVRPVYAVTELTTRKTLSMGGARDPRARAFGFLLAPVLIPTSALVSGIIVGTSGATSTTTQRLVARDHYPCSAPAPNVRIDVGLPTGATLVATTDHRGDATFTVPPSEPYAGRVALRAEGAADLAAAYSLPRPAYVRARDAVLECAAKQALTGHIDLKLSINASGFVSRLWLSTGDADTNACVAQHLAGVEFPAATRDKTIALPLAVL